jgi:hypothetical protein
MTRIVTTVLVGLAAIQSAQAPPEPLLRRQYREGDAWVHRIEGRNAANYSEQIAGSVRRRADGVPFDELTWLSAPDLRQAITLDGASGPFSPADVAAGIAKAPRLVGPFTDLLTFYADLYLAMHAGALRQTGDRFHYENSTLGSWADGRNVLVGEDHIDFVFELTNIDRTSSVATVHVQHVPPVAPRIQLPADWMRAPVADTPNNFVQVRRTTGGYRASIGKETFDVTLRIRLSDGMLLGATMTNPVETMDRECVDRALTNCAESRPGRLVREVELTLVR